MILHTNLNTQFRADDYMIIQIWDYIQLQRHLPIFLVK